MSIPDHLVEEVRQRADLVEIVSEYTRLKRSGKTFRGPCPLHGGQGPNFSVDPAKGFYKCFVCGEGGSAFTFLQRHLGLSFPDAVRHVAARVGVEIPEPGADRQVVDPNQHLYGINAFAAEWFQKQLRVEPSGARAREYLERRGVSEAAQTKFGLGWAPESWGAFGDAARAHGIGEEHLLALGLIKTSERSGSRYDAFRGRVVFPITDAGGRVIAFGGRVIGDEVPKYLNSPESPIYHKGNVLYGLAWSRGAIRKAETALVVEGYMDYVSLASHGVDNAVAPLGTALTQEQAELLARYARRVILLYDSDTAGLKATFRAGDELLRAGVEVLVATLPEGEDPDSLVRGSGAKALNRYLDDAVDLLDRKISILERRGLFGSIAGVRRAVDALLPSLRAASDEILRGVYLSRIADKTGVPRETLEREAAAPDKPGTVSGRPRQADPAQAGARHRRASPSPEPAPATGRPFGAERNLLLLLLRDDTFLERAARELEPADFREPVFQAVYDCLLHAAGARGSEEWLESFPVELRPVVESLRGDPEAAHLTAPEQMFEASLRHIQARPFQDRLAEIERKLIAAEPDEQGRLLVEKAELSRTMRERNLLFKPGTMRWSAGAS
jgi:DNA primase